MPPRTTSASGPALGFETKLWQAADLLRGHMDAAEYKHTVLGLIFLKYISDAFDRRHAQLLAEEAECAGPEDPDEYQAVGAFWVPKAARWEAIQSQAANASIGIAIDAAMEAIERYNPTLRDVLPKGYQRPTLNKQQLGELVNLISGIALGSDLARKQDVPATFQDSPLGPMPEGWIIESVGSVARLTKGRSYKSDHLAPSSTALVTLKSFLRGGGYRHDGLKEYTGPYAEEQLVHPGDVVVALTDVTQAADVVGRAALVGESSYDALVASLDVGILRPDDERVSLPFLFG